LQQFTSDAADGAILDAIITSHTSWLKDWAL